jgi:hypothetical protein
MLDWDRDVMPVLQATYDVWTAAMAIDPHARFGVPGQEINEKLGRDADDPRTAVVLDRLRDAGLVDGEGVSGQKNPDDVLVTAKGLQYVAGWPATPDEAAVARLLAVLDQRIQEAPTPEARSNWTRLRDAVSALPREVLADVIAQVVTRAPGM